MVEQEKTHKRFKSVAINISVFFVLTLANVLKGSKAGASIIGLKACSIGYWMVLLVFLIYAGAVTVYSVKKM